MDYKEQIFELLGVEEQEPFILIPSSTGCKECSEHCFRINRLLNVEQQVRGTVRWDTSGITLVSILRGDYDVQKMPKEPKTREDKAAVVYAQVCGYKYIAKDADGTVYCWERKPRKNEYAGEWEGGSRYMEIECKAPFIQWTDKEPCYIDDINIF